MLSEVADLLVELMIALRLAYDKRWGMGRQLWNVQQHAKERR